MIAAEFAFLAVALGAVWLLTRPANPAPVAVGSPSPTPTATDAPSPSPRPTRTPAAPSPSPTETPGPVVTPRPTPIPTRPPLILPAGIADVGSRAVVRAGVLRVRNYPGLDTEIRSELLAGTELLMLEGPIPTDGLDWYLVAYPELPDGQGEGVSEGWVAVGPSGSPPTLVGVELPRCPSLSPSASLFASMGGLARSQCLGTDSYEFTAVVDTCYEGPITAYSYQPPWLWFSCISVFDLGSPTHLQIFFPPDVPGPGDLVRGNVLRVVGHFGDPAAEECSISLQPGIVEPEPSAVERALFRLQCRTSFVLESWEVVDTIELPPLF